MDDDRATAPSRSRMIGWQGRWRELWQVPVLVVSVALIIAGFWQARRNAPRHDYEGVFAQVAAHLDAGRLDEAGALIKETLEPTIAAAPPAHQAHFHLLAGDWLVRRQEAAELPTAEGWAAAIEQYDHAVRLGATPGIDRLTRRALASIALNDLDAAHAAMDAIAAMETDDLDGRDQARAIIQRRLIDVAITSGRAGAATLDSMLAEYRLNAGLRGSDEAWACARLAELRLREGRPHDAINQLLVDMRRIAPRLDERDTEVAGELYGYLGEAYAQVGEESLAEANLQHALELLPDTTLTRGRAETALGLLLVGRGDLEEAVDRFSSVIRDYAGAPLVAVALLGRAEALAALGDHDDSLTDYAALARLVRDRKADARVTRDRVADSLMTQHDAALAQRLVPQASRYIDQAHALFEPAVSTAPILLRRAAITRLEAETAEREASEHRAAKGVPDPALEAAAAKHFLRAGNRYVEHARAIEGEIESDDDWADSIWMAADSFDRAGQHEQAAQQFQAYIESHAEDDGRAAEARFRLAQSLLAAGRTEEAVRAFEATIENFKTSPFAARSYVPLAHCMVRLGLQADAEATLRLVLDGRVGVQPEATAYRDALVSYGTLLHTRGDHRRAIEALDECIRRYPDDRQLNEFRFRLGDACRRIAQEQRHRIDHEDLPPAERQAEAESRQRYLVQAMTLFDQVIEGYDRRDPRSLDALEQDFRRLAHLYRADSAFELGRFEEAIALYDQAERRYSDHPVSMIALIQIVNCHYALNRPDKARTAHRRAELRLAQLPRESFEGSESILDRATWERWLQNAPITGRLAIAGATGEQE